MRFRLTSSWAMRPPIGENASGVLPNVLQLNAAERSGVAI